MKSYACDRCGKPIQADSGGYPSGGSMHVVTDHSLSGGGSFDLCFDCVLEFRDVLANYLRVPWPTLAGVEKVLIGALL